MNWNFCVAILFLFAAHGAVLYPRSDIDLLKQNIETAVNLILNKTSEHMLTNITEAILHGHLAHMKQLQYGDEYRVFINETIGRLSNIVNLKVDASAYENFTAQVLYEQKQMEYHHNQNIIMPKNLTNVGKIYTAEHATHMFNNFDEERFQKFEQINLELTSGNLTQESASHILSMNKTDLWVLSLKVQVIHLLIIMDTNGSHTDRIPQLENSTLSQLMADACGQLDAYENNIGGGLMVVLSGGACSSLGYLQTCSFESWDELVRMSNEPSFPEDITVIIASGCLHKYAIELKVAADLLHHT